MTSAVFQQSEEQRGTISDIDFLGDINPIATAVFHLHPRAKGLMLIFHLETLHFHRVKHCFELFSSEEKASRCQLSITKVIVNANSLHEYIHRDKSNSCFRIQPNSEVNRAEGMLDKKRAILTIRENLPTQSHSFDFKDFEE